VKYVRYPVYINVTHLTLLLQISTDTLYETSNHFSRC